MDRGVFTAASSFGTDRAAHTARLTELCCTCVASARGLFVARGSAAVRTNVVRTTFAPASQMSLRSDRVMRNPGMPQRTVVRKPAKTSAISIPVPARGGVLRGTTRMPQRAIDTAKSTRLRSEPKRRRAPFKRAPLFQAWDRLARLQRRIRRRTDSRRGTRRAESVGRS